MNELILKIEQWAEDRNIINGTKPIDQAMKLFSEAGELADNIGKGRNCFDDIGDCMVVLTVITKQLGGSVSDLNFKSLAWAEGENKQLLLNLIDTMQEFTAYASTANFLHVGLLKRCINILNGIAKNHKVNLEQCVAIAYDDIKHRKGVVFNGVFIKESDQAYKEALIKLGKA